MPIHVDNILYLASLPDECIRECAAPGSRTEVVQSWRRRLELTVDREKAIECLNGYGDYLGEEQDDETLACDVLYFACCSFYGFMLGGHAAGSDIFVLE